ncbi:MAG TPA: class I SAM-dependent methyltransferase [Allosphingosinicella sp.]|nr:class I SAM-dependent methyltransferase [Allosphingosinicella sp.]
MTRRYDRIGVNYSDLRRPDPRIAAMIEAALGASRSLLNVGAGTGSYEPAGREVVALEPSIEMIRQRASRAAAIVQGRAEQLPFADKSFDASMAILTVHHWSDPAQGLAEMRRVTSGPIVILTYDPCFRGFWLADYLPGLVALDEAQMPAMAEYERRLGPVAVASVPIPNDCSDGFLCAYWRRPAAYLDPRVRAAMSSFWALGDVSGALARLEADIESGAWARRHGGLLALDSLDCGYRLVVTD